GLRTALARRLPLGLPRGERARRRDARRAPLGRRAGVGAGAARRTRAGDRARRRRRLLARPAVARRAPGRRVARRARPRRCLTRARARARGERSQSVLARATAAVG